MSTASDLERLGLEVTTYEDLSVTSAAVITLTEATVDTATFITVTVEGGDVRFTRNNVDPTSSFGLIARNHDSLSFSQKEARKARFISTSSSVTVTLHVEYYVPKEQNVQEAF